MANFSAPLKGDLPSSEAPTSRWAEIRERPIFQLAAAFAVGCTLTFIIAFWMISKNYTPNKVVAEQYETRETLKSQWKPVLDVQRDYFLKAEVEAKYLPKAVVHGDYMQRSEISNGFISKTDVEALYLSRTVVEEDYVSRNELDRDFIPKTTLQSDFISKSEVSGHYLLRTDVADNYVLRTEVPQLPSRISPGQIELSDLRRAVDSKAIQVNDWLVFWPVPGKERAQTMLAERVDGPRKDPVVPGRSYQVIENDTSRDGRWFKVQFTEPDGTTSKRWYLFDAKNLLTYIAPSTGFPLLRAK